MRSRSRLVAGGCQADISEARRRGPQLRRGRALALGGLRRRRRGAFRAARRSPRRLPRGRAGAGAALAQRRRGRARPGRPTSSWSAGRSSSAAAMPRRGAGRRRGRRPRRIGRGPWRRRPRSNQRASLSRSLRLESSPVADRIIRLALARRACSARSVASRELADLAALAGIVEEPGMQARPVLKAAAPAALDLDLGAAGGRTGPCRPRRSSRGAPAGAARDR